MALTLEQLAAQVEALTAELEAMRADEPEIVENWGLRTCAICGAEAVMIDTTPATRKVSRNGEGYCAEHGGKAKVDKGDHLKR